eukprot:4106485-Amphidinium_carterae.2
MGFDPCHALDKTILVGRQLTVHMPSCQILKATLVHITSCWHQLQANGEVSLGDHSGTYDHGSSATRPKAKLASTSVAKAEGMQRSSWAKCMETPFVRHLRWGPKIREDGLSRSSYPCIVWLKLSQLCAILLEGLMA